MHDAYICMFYVRYIFHMRKFRSLEIAVEYGMLFDNVLLIVYVGIYFEHNIQ